MTRRSSQTNILYLDSSIDNKLVERLNWSLSPGELFESIHRVFVEINFEAMEIAEDRENGTKECKKEIKQKTGKPSEAAQPVNQP